MDVIEAIRTQRAVREFSDRPVIAADINTILDAGRRAQSSKNQQPWTFIAIRDRTTLQLLSECGDYAGHLAEAAFAVALVTPWEHTFDLGQAAANLQLAAWDLGIGSCLAAIYNEDKAKAILGIPAEQHFTYAISFGYPRRQPQRAPVRHPLERVVRWERWG
jgi:nitroreductase